MENRKLKPAAPPEDRLKIHTETHSDRTGVAGWFERFARKYKRIGFSLTMAPLFGLFTFVITVSLYPAVLTFQWITGLVGESPLYIKAAGYSYVVVNVHHYADQIINFLCISIYVH